MVGNANANGIPFLKRYGIPSAIKNSMILWYDIARQGATNESMAENPILKDLSGNGHDATCSNFAWGGMSGINGYSDNLRNYKINSYDGFVIEVVNDHKFTINGNIGLRSYYNVLVNFNDYSAKRGSLYAKGVHDDLHFIYQINGATSNPNASIQIKNGLNEFDFIPNETSNFMKFQLVNKTEAIIENVNIEIEFLPLYPNALVFDGEDDYALAEGLPLLNKEDGYTVILRRKWLKNTDVRHCLVSKNTKWGTTAQGGIDGAFAMECDVYNTMSFGISTKIDITLENTDDFVYQTSRSYNGKTTIESGDAQDANHLCIAAINKGKLWRSSIAVYSLILFNRDLSTKEIEWVKENM